MRIIKPNETLKFFGFNQNDIENLTKIVDGRKKIENIIL